MLRTHRFSVLLTLYFFGSLILFLWGVQQMPVTDPVESLYALTAKEMVLSGDWISPQVFGSFWYDKPPFMYWLLSASYSVFGFSNFASRLPAAFCGALSVSFMAWYVRRILNDETAAVWAAAFLATALEFWVISHAVITDSALFLFAIPTFFSGYIGVKEKSWKHITIAWAAAALACLTKGPVGLVLPGAILFLWCLSIRSFGGLARLFSPAGILVFLLIAGPWYYTMYDIHGQAFIDQFFGLHNVTRALSSEHPEDNYFFYYLVLLPVALLPWTGLSFYTMVKKWKEKTDLYKFLMIACWGTVLFYTLVATKYVTYTYIAVAPAVFLAVLALDDFRQEENKPAHAALVIPFVLTLAALVAGSLYIDGNFLSLYVIVMYSGFLIFTQWKKKQFPSMLILSSATMAVAYMCAVFGGLAAWVGTRSALDMTDALHSLPGEHYFFKSYPASYTYHTGEVGIRVYDAGMQKRDAVWETKQPLPTITTDELLAKSGDSVLYVGRREADDFTAWPGHERFEEVQAFPSGTIYRMEK